MNPFREIFLPYFDWLTNTFGHLANEAKKHNISSGDIARDLLSNSGRREEFIEFLPHVRKTVETFWRDNHKLIASEVNKLTGLKARYGGDIGPKPSSAIFQRAGLYFDTILVPDPLLRIAKLPPKSKIPEYYLLKYGIDQVLSKDTYLADVYPPIAILVPDRELTQQEPDFSKLSHLAKLDCIMLTNELYGQDFNDYHDAARFYASFRDLAEAVDLIKKPDLIYLDEDAPRDPISQIDANASRTKLDWEQIDPDTPDFLLFTFLGRMMQINDLLRGAIARNAHPIVDAPVSFHWLRWKIKANQARIANQLGLPTSLNLNLTNSLLSQNLNWLSNVQVKDLIQLRQQGNLAELRSIINQEMDRLSLIDLDDTGTIAKQIDYNLSTALARHQEEITELERAIRSELAISGSSLLLGVAASLQASQSPPSPAWLQMVPQIVGVTSLSKVVASVASYLKDRRRLGKKPIGILWHTTRKLK